MAIRRLSCWSAVQPWQTVLSPDGATWTVLPTSSPPRFRLRSQHDGREVELMALAHHAVEIVEPTEPEVRELLMRELGATIIR